MKPVLKQGRLSSAGVFAPLVLTILAGIFLAAPAHASAIDLIYRHGNSNNVKPPPYILPNCNPLALRFGSTANCNKCCSEPDLILQHQFRGTDPLGNVHLNKWFIDTLWPLLDAKIAETSNSIVSTLQTETSKIGGFYEAQNNMRTLNSLQKASAASGKKYFPSEALCRYATLSQGLAASDGNSDALKIVMNDRSMDRQLLLTNVASGEDVEGEMTRGQSADKEARWRLYEQVFCDPASNNEQGTGAGVCQSSSDEQYNRDVNYARTIDDPFTLDVGTNVGVTKDVQNINALANNLYASDITYNAPKAELLDPDTGNEDQIRKYMVMRAAIAKRAVAENSFNSIVALKAKGAPATAEATRKLLMELGMGEEEAKKFVKDNPSYYEQMEALTNRLYQTPTFYVNLMESETNVQRQQAALKALELVQQRDMYKSYQRSEILMAMLLDLYVTRVQGGLDKTMVQSTR